MLVRGEFRGSLRRESCSRLCFSHRRRRHGTDSIGPGSLDRPTGGLPHTGDALNRTHWKVQVGDSITAQIQNVTDANLQGATEADVVIKSSERGNTTVHGTKSGTTITFSWVVPRTPARRSIVAYGPVGSNPTGNNSNNDIIRQLFQPPGSQAVAGFAAVDWAAAT